MAEISEITQSGQSAGTLTPQISNKEIEQLDQIYTIRDREEVLAFLEEHPFIIPVLLEAPERIKPYFGDASLALEINLDPEDTFFDSVVLVIATKLGWKKAFGKRNRLVGSWIIGHQSYEVRKNLMIETRNDNEL